MCGSKQTKMNKIQKHGSFIVAKNKFIVMKKVFFLMLKLSVTDLEIHKKVTNPKFLFLNDRSSRLKISDKVADFFFKEGNP